MANANTSEGVAVDEEVEAVGREEVVRGLEGSGIMGLGMWALATGVVGGGGD